MRQTLGFLTSPAPQRTVGRCEDQEPHTGVAMARRMHLRPKTDRLTLQRSADRSRCHLHPHHVTRQMAQGLDRPETATYSCSKSGFPRHVRGPATSPSSRIDHDIPTAALSIGQAFGHLTRSRECAPQPCRPDRPCEPPRPFRNSCGSPRPRDALCSSP